MGILFAILLAYVNGANDNFKGVATLYGSRSTTFRTALTWATITTFAGSICAVIISHGLVATFSGKGLVPDSLVQSSGFGLAIIMGATGTVFLATKLGIPISTTHAIIGSLVGAGASAAAPVNSAQLSNTFLIPLIASPLLALAFAVVFYPTFKLFRTRLGIKRGMCLCIGNEVIMDAPENFIAGITTASLQIPTMPSLTIDTQVNCVDRYQGRLLGIEVKSVIDFFHFLSAGVVCFSRGLNDTPKIIGILLLTASLPAAHSFGMIAIAMAIGGIISSRKVAETMALKVTEMNHGQSFTANLITSLIVIGASKIGLPVSTTHVSCGALFGIGVVNKKANWTVIRQILLAWALTLPIGALIASLSYQIIMRVIS